MASYWQIWVEGTSSTNVGTTDGVWGQWTLTTSSTANTSVWVEWNIGVDVGTTTDGLQTIWSGWNGSIQTYQYPPIHQPTAEEIAKAKAETEAREKERLEAYERSKKLLEALCDLEQRDQLNQYKHFIVKAKERRYRLHLDGKVEELEKESDKAVATFCIHPANDGGLPIPMPDQVLAKKLLLEVNEEKFLKTANRTALR